VTAVSSNDVWAAGGINNSSDSLVEHWDGTSWSIVSSPAFTGAGGLNGISADTSKDVWAVGGASGTPTVLHWDGRSWSQGPQFAGNAGHTALTALAPTNVWVVGEETTSLKHVRPLIRHWDGTTWAIVPSPDPDPRGRFSVLNGIAAISASDIWAVGQVNGQTLTEHFNGTDWKIINSPNPAVANRLFGVTALSAGTVVAVGDSTDSAGTLNGLILSNWSTGPAPAMSDPAPAASPSSSSGVQSLVFVASPAINGLELLTTAAIAHNDIWAIGNVVSGPGAVQPVAEHFDGTKWSVVPTTSFNSDSLSGVAKVASNDVWAVGTLFGKSGSESTLIEHWNGTSWSVVASPTPTNGGFLNAVTAVSSNDVWAAGDVLDATGAPVAALVEHWNGTSWSIVSSSAFGKVTGVGAISADASNDVWAAAGATVLHFNGTKWSLVNPNTGVGIIGVEALSPKNVWALGDGRDTDGDSFFARIEHWDGSGWSIVPSPRVNPPEPLDSSSYLAGVAAISANDIWAVGGAVGKSLTEHWDGTSWSVIASPNPGQFNFLFAATALSDGTVAAVGAETDSVGNATGLILQNAASAPKTTTTAAAATTTMSAPLGAAPVMTTGSAAGAQTTAISTVPRERAPVDQLFAAAPKPLPFLSFIGHSSAVHKTAAIWDLDFLPEDIGMLD
jgi:hypothetical protein